LKIFEQPLVEKWCTCANFRRNAMLCNSAQWLTFDRQTPVEIFSADLDVIFSTGPWLKIFHRDHDRD